MPSFVERSSNVEDKLVITKHSLVLCSVSTGFVSVESVSE